MSASKIIFESRSEEKKSFPVWNFSWSRSLRFLFLLTFAVTMFFPFLWMLATSVKTADPLLLAQEGPGSGIFPVGGNPLKSLFPKVWHWENYRDIFFLVPFGRYYFNSFFVAALVTIGQLTTCSMAAFAFSRLEFKGRNILFYCYIATLMIPSSVVIIPTFIFFSKVGLVDTLTALIVPAIFGAYGTFMLRQFFIGIPVELEEAATIDGCGPFRVYWHVILPMARPALATLGIFTFMGNWQNLFTPLILIHSEKNKTIPLGLMNFVDLNSADWPRLMTASILSLIPIVIIFLVAQRFFTAGIRLGGVKG